MMHVVNIFIPLVTQTVGLYVVCSRSASLYWEQVSPIPGLIPNQKQS